MLLVNLLIVLAIFPSSDTIETSIEVPPSIPDPVVLFNPNSQELDELAEDTLKWWASALNKSESVICLWLIGECDPVTDGASCEDLASRRLQTVERFLVQYGVGPDLLSPYPSGRTHPPCDYAACRVSLRRVVIMFPGQGPCSGIPQQ